ncbi:MAG: DUF2800 domain-containing protein, partial [Clostridiaceae bacterium]|nr:DUF2800 domain-containing protein [Clostridiaceae bacterium]
MDAERDDIVVLVDEDGEEVEFEHIDTIEMNGNEYVILVPLAEEEDDEVEDILARIDALVSWANDIKTYALQAALGGKEWNGWKLIEGRSIRKY